MRQVDCRLSKIDFPLQIVSIEKAHFSVVPRTSSLAVRLRVFHLKIFIYRIEMMEDNEQNKRAVIDPKQITPSQPQDFNSS